MKKFRLLLLAFVVSMLFAIPTFADVKNLFPLSMQYGAGNVMFSEPVEIDERQAASIIPNLKNGDVVKEVNVIGVKGLKTTLMVTADNTSQIAWNKSGTVKKGYSGVNYSQLSITPSKNAVVYATISDGADKVKVKFNIVSIIPPNTDHLAPYEIGYGRDRNLAIKDYCNEYYEELSESIELGTCNYYCDDSSYLFRTSSDVLHNYDGTDSYDRMVELEAGENVCLHVVAIDGAKFKWSVSGKTINKDGISVICFKPTKSGMVYCTISCGTTSLKVPFKLKIDNDLRTEYPGDIYAYENCCNGSKVTTEFTLRGYDLKKLKVKSNGLRGKGFSYKFGKVNQFNDVQYRDLYITYTPTSDGESKFTVSDQYDGTVTLSCDVTLQDHYLPPLGEGTIKKAPTAIATGSEVAVCSECNKKITRTIPKLTATIKVPATYKIKIGKKEQISVTLTKGDYITSVTATKNGKTVIIKVFKKSNCFWVQGINAGTSEVTVKTKAGKIATCKVTAYK